MSNLIHVGVQSLRFQSMDKYLNPDAGIEEQHIDQATEKSQDECHSV
jgi:hypothetical protein